MFPDHDFIIFQESKLLVEKTRAPLLAFLLSVLVVSLFPLEVQAQASSANQGEIALPPGVTRGPVAEGISEFRFANGFKVLLLPDASQKAVTLNITYLVGSRHENYGETGMAHLLEHLLFKGTPRTPAIPQEFSRRGMSANATTGIDRTNYIETFQAGDENLRWAIAMEADRMLNSHIARKDLDTEMTVVRNEFEQGENSPFQVMIKRMQSVAYDWHSYSRSPIGNRSDIENVRIKNLRAFYQTYYQPDNAVMMIAGHFSPGQVLRWVNQSFGKLARPKRTLPEFWTVEPTQDGERQFFIRRSGDMQLVVVGYKTASIGHADYNALTVAAAVLTNTPNGRLHKSLVESGLATQIETFQLSGLAPGMQFIAATAKQGADIEAIRQGLVAGIESFATTPPTEVELARFRQEQVNFHEQLQNDPQQLAVSMSDAIALGDWRLLFAVRDDLLQVSAPRAAAAAAKYFRRDNRTVGLFVPEDQPQRTDVPVAPSISAVLEQYHPHQQIAAAEAFDTTPANIDRHTRVLLPGQGQHTGLKLALLPKSTRGDTVTVNLHLEFGDQQSLFGRQVQARMMEMMLLRGTTSKSRQELLDAIQHLKINGDLLGFQTTRENLVPALQLQADILRNPSFDVAQFEQVRQELLLNLEAERKDPSARANAVMALHFSHYPTGDWRSEIGLEQKIAEVKSATLEQIKQFHREFYGASNGQLVIVGAFDPDTAVKAVDDAFAGWASKTPYARVLESWADIPPTRELIDTPDKENGFYLARQNIRMRDTDAAYPALIVANYLIGGSPTKSRLADRVRQKDGLSYGIESMLQLGGFHDVGYFAVRAISAPQNLDKVEAAVRQELVRVVKDGFTAEELENAQSGILQLRQRYRENDANLAADWVEALALDRHYQWSAQLDEKIRTLTLAQLNAAVRLYIDPAQMSVVIARDKVLAER
jgi:zinc protease